MFLAVFLENKVHSRRLEDASSSDSGNRSSCRLCGSVKDVARCKLNLLQEGEWRISHHGRGCVRGSLCQGLSSLAPGRREDERPWKEVVICLEGENLLLVNLNSLLLCHVNLNLMLALILTSSTPYPVPRYCYSVHFQRYSHLRDLVKMRIIVSPPRLLYSGTLCGHCIM